MARLPACQAAANDSGMTEQTLGFIGLGNLGLPIAENLLSAGYKLRVYNRTREKAAPLAAKGATVVDSPAEACPRGGIVITVLADDKSLEAVADDHFCAALGDGGIHLSLSTLLPATSESLAERHRKFGVTYLGSPVFGRPEAAAARKLWVCVSGPAGAKDRARPVLQAIGQGIFDFGENPGAANVMKLAGNFVINAAVEAMAEAAALGERNGIPRADLIGMLTQTLFACPVYQNYGRRVIAADFEKVGFTLPLGLKDVNLMLATAAASKTPLPLAGMMRDRMLSAMAKGREHLDAAVFALGAADDAGLTWFNAGAKKDQP